MSVALPMVKDMISDLVKNAPKIPTWVLTSFNDPKATLIKVTSSVKKLRKSLDSLDYRGGRDPREEVLKGGGCWLWDNKIWSYIINASHTNILAFLNHTTRSNISQDLTSHWTRYQTTELSWSSPMLGPSSFNWRNLSERKAWRRMSRSISRFLPFAAKIVRSRFQFTNVCQTVGCSTIPISAARCSSELSSPRFQIASMHW